MKSKLLKRSLAVLLVAAGIAGITAAGLSTSAEQNAEQNTVIPSSTDPSKNQYQVVSPVPTGSSIKPITQPSRLSTLEGKTIALVGGSFSASVTHKIISDMLEQEYHCKTYYMTDEVGKSGTFNPNNISDKSEEFMENLKKYKIDAVISGNCGCGICTVKETGNGLAAEYAGIPAVVVGAEAALHRGNSTRLEALQKRRALAQVHLLLAEQRLAAHGEALVGHVVVAPRGEERERLARRALVHAREPEVAVAGDHRDVLDDLLRDLLALEQVHERVDERRRSAVVFGHLVAKRCLHGVPLCKNNL